MGHRSWKHLSPEGIEVEIDELDTQRQEIAEEIATLDVQLEALRHRLAASADTDGELVELETRIEHCRRRLKRPDPALDRRIDELTRQRDEIDARIAEKKILAQKSRGSRVDRERLEELREQRNVLRERLMHQADEQKDVAALRARINKLRHKRTYLTRQIERRRKVQRYKRRTE